MSRNNSGYEISRFPVKRVEQKLKGKYSGGGKKRSLA